MGSVPYTDALTLYGGISISESESKLTIKRKRWQYTLMMGAVLALAYLLDNLLFGPRWGGISGNYILPSLLWGLLLLFNLCLPGARPGGRLRLRRLIWGLALLCVFIGLLGEAVTGALGGFGRSPFDRSLAGLLLNLLSVGSMLAAVEFSRSWLINRHFGKRPVAGVALTGLLFSFFTLPLNQILNLNDKLAVTKFMGMTFFPGLGENILASYLAFLGGPLPAVIYRGGLLLFERLSPFLPVSGWVIQTLMGTMAPVLGLILVQQVYREESRQVPSRRGESYLGWFATSMAAIVIIWFAMGVFSYAPRVVVSGSMQPTLNIGDVVIIKKIEGRQAKTGDIIMFPMGNMKVTHRLIKVVDMEGKRAFVTKGDANGDYDNDLLAEKNVQGKVVLVLPKAGWLTLLLRSGG